MTRSQLKKIYREAAGLIAEKKQHFCCDAIRQVARTEYADFQYAKNTFAEIFEPPHHRKPADSYGWWWHTCGDTEYPFGIRCHYNPREARIFALLSAAELV